MVMRSTRTVLSLSLGVIAAAGAASAQPVQAVPSGTTIRTNVQEVVLDLIVRDAKGREVKNLKPSDVEIYEDGVRQDIRGFRFVTGKEALVEAGETAKSTGGTIANPLPAMNLVCLVFHNLDTDPATRSLAVQAAQEFLKNHIEPNTWVGVFGLDVGLSVIEPFTTDRQGLLAAATTGFSAHTVDFASASEAVLNASPNVERVRVAFNGNPAAGGTVSASSHMTGGTLNSQAIVGADVANGPAARAVRGDQADQRRQFGGIEGMRELDQMNEMFEKFGTLPGRKTVLLFSPGLAATGDPDQFQAMISRARKAGVTVYAIDINGLTQNSTALASSADLHHSASLSAQQSQGSGSIATTGATSGGGAVTMEHARQDDYTMEAVRMSDTQAILRGMAEGTGGFLIGSTNDFRKPYERILENLNTHYEAVYHPTSTKYDGHLRAIEVKLLRPGLTVENRTGYFALPLSSGEGGVKPSELSALTALNAQPEPKAFPFRTAAYQFRSGANDAQRGLVFEIPASDFTLTPDAATHKQRMSLSLVSLVKDGGGQVVDQFSQDTSLNVPDDKVPELKRNMITFTHPLSLPPGLYSVDTAVVDAEGNRAATGKLMFNNMPQKGLTMSSILMVQRLEPVSGKPDPSDPFEFQAGKDERRRVVPELRNAFLPAAKPAVYFVVYPDPSVADKPKIEVEFRNGGKVLAKQTAELPPPDATGAIPMVVGAVAQPGRCELRITASQGNATTMQNLFYTVVAQ